MRVAVVFTAYNRPEYLTETLQSWYKTSCDVPFMFQVEPDCSPVIELCYGAVFKDLTVTINPVRLGALQNPKAALNSAFEWGYDFVILAEDDTIVSPDVLDYFKFCASYYKNRDDVPLVCSFNRDPIGQPYEVFLRHWFGSPVWGTWAKDWEYLEPLWSDNYGPAWDSQLVDRVSIEQWAVFPCISRSQLIGQYNGTHMAAEDFDRLKARRMYSGPSVEFKEALWLTS